MESMNCQIQILTKYLAKAHEKLAAQPTATPVATALAVPPSQAVAAAQHPPASLAPPQMAHPAATPLPPMATTQAPQYLEMKSLHTLEGPGDRTGGLCGASSAMKRGILPTAVLPALCYSVC